MIGILKIFIKTGIISLVMGLSIFAQTKYRNVLISDANEPNEVAIIVNPNDNRHIVAAANLDGFYYSLNSGQDWEIRKLVSKEFGVWGDPCLVFDATGALYYFHLASNDKYWYDRIICQKSYDGGISWEEPGTFIGNNPPHLQDKEWVCCDLTYSPYRNNLYIVWTQCGQSGYDYGTATPNQDENSGSNIFFSHSTNGGNDWSRMKRINDLSGSFCTNVDSTVLGVVNCIGAKGEVYVSWVSPFGVMFDKTTDAGETWTDKDVKAANLPGGFKFNIPGIYRAFGFSSIASDNSYSIYRNSIYICWNDQRNGDDDTDVWLVKSTSGGLTWSTPKRINDDLTKTHQFFSWVTVDQSYGYIYIVFYDRRNHAGNETDVYLARSTDGGDTFVNEQISQWPFDPDQSVFFGDYINITANNGMIRPVWTRLEESKLSIWTAIIDEF